MSAKVFCILFPLICFLYLITPTMSQMVSSTYGGWSNDPGFASGMKNMLDYLKNYTHSGYGPVGNGFTGSMHVAMPQFGPAKPAGGKAAGALYPLMFFRF
ncbi:uncharacterized protein LOC116348189 isoform X2 [Contarinia nasturtii]|uniref:uncharacterized protein LOC116348189 isoform X2 n=1 Tax=Contarinia nasturtii TaxID=265458 RepID=UPI0012D3A687|nr:uncharacterized protein LOC116348189 isoform X2 [Contarinia nasturtii]